MYKVNLDDIREWVEGYGGERFHAILTDPPYNLESIKKRFGKSSDKPAKYGVDGAFSRVSKGFMGQDWDTDIAFDPKLWKSIKKLLYPGAFGLSYMGARTYHRLATAVEDAGFVIHPMIGWVQSQGFPKPTRIDRQIPDNAIRIINVFGRVVGKNLSKIWSKYRYGVMSLKPCMEPILMFQKPYENRPVDDIINTGAGALNVEDTSFSVGREFVVNTFDDGAKPFGGGAGHSYTGRTKNKLYPTTFIIDEFTGEPYNNFFYQAKVMKKEREAGLDDFPVNEDTGKRNNHPTLKPIDLNRHLSSILLPPEEYSPRRILVPFSGVGSEMIGALLAGWDYVEGIELKEENIEMTEARIKYWLQNEKD